jgi:hypothetical protein
MSDFEKEGRAPYENSGKRGILRLASFALPSVVTILSLLICWRRHFDKNSIEGAGVGIAGSVYCAISDIRHANMGYRVHTRFARAQMNAIVVKALHITVALLLTLGLLVVGALAADAYHFLLIHGWALAHGSIPVIFPLYFWGCYSALRPLAKRLSGTS